MGGRKAISWDTDVEIKVGQKSKQEKIATIENTFDKTIEVVTEFNTSRLEERPDYFGADRTKNRFCYYLLII